MNIEFHPVLIQMELSWSKKLAYIESVLSILIFQQQDNANIYFGCHDY